MNKKSSNQVCVQNLLIDMVQIENWQIWKGQTLIYALRNKTKSVELAALSGHSSAQKS